MLTCLTVFSDDTEEVLVHETVMKFDNGGMVKLEGGGGRERARNRIIQVAMVVNTNTLKLQ